MKYSEINSGNALVVARMNPDNTEDIIRSLKAFESFTPYPSFEEEIMKIANFFPEKTFDIVKVLLEFSFHRNMVRRLCEKHLNSSMLRFIEEYPISCEEHLDKQMLNLIKNNAVFADFIFEEFRELSVSVAKNYPEKAVKIAMRYPEKTEELAALYPEKFKKFKLEGKPVSENKKPEQEGPIILRTYPCNYCQ